MTTMVVGAAAFVTDPQSLHRNTVGIVTALTPTGRVQVTFADGDIELYDSMNVVVRGGVDTTKAHQ